LESGRRDVVGRLRVSLPLLFGRHCVAPILRAFARQHPKLELELSFSDRQVDLVADGFDLAVRNGDLGQGLTLRARKLVSQRKVLCASPGYLAAKGRPERLEDLAAHERLGYWRNGRALDWRLPDADGVLVDVPVMSRLRFDDLEVIVDAVAEGMGLAWVPEWLVAPLLAMGDLVEVWPDRPSAALECYAVWPATPHMPLRTRLAIDALVAEVPNRLEVRRAQADGSGLVSRVG
jgi:DNA-binding transcriptional LysR family regulator